VADQVPEISFKSSYKIFQICPKFRLVKQQTGQIAMFDAL